MFKGKSMKTKKQRLCVYFLLFHLQASCVPNFLFFWRENFEGAPLALEGSESPMKSAEPRTRRREKNKSLCRHTPARFHSNLHESPTGPPVRVRNLQPPGASSSLCFAVGQPACCLCWARSGDGFSEVCTCPCRMATRLPTHVPWATAQQWVLMTLECFVFDKKPESWLCNWLQLHKLLFGMSLNTYTCVCESS